MEVVGGPHDGEQIEKTIAREWVWLLPDDRITIKAEYGERRGGLLHRVVPAESLSSMTEARGAVLLYVGDRYVSCPSCRGAFVRRDRGVCMVCSNVYA